MIVPTKTTPGKFCGVPWYLDAPPITAQVCACCKHEAIEYPIRLCRHNAEFMTALLREGRPAMKKDLKVYKLSDGAYSGGHSAHHWRFILSAEGSSRGPWELTPFGQRFLAGDVSVPTTIILFIPHVGDSYPVRFTGAPTCVEQLAVEGDYLYEQAKEAKKAAKRARG